MKSAAIGRRRQNLRKMPRVTRERDGAGVAAKREAQACRASRRSRRRGRARTTSASSCCSEAFQRAQSCSMNGAENGSSSTSVRPVRRAARAALRTMSAALAATDRRRARGRASRRRRTSRGRTGSSTGRIRALSVQPDRIDRGQAARFARLVQRMLEPRHLHFVLQLHPRARALAGLRFVRQPDFDVAPARPQRRRARQRAEARAADVPARRASAPGRRRPDPRSAASRPGRARGLRRSETSSVVGIDQHQMIVRDAHVHRLDAGPERIAGRAAVGEEHVGRERRVVRTRCSADAFATPNWRAIQRSCGSVRWKSSPITRSSSVARASSFSRAGRLQVVQRGRGVRGRGQREREQEVEVVNGHDGAHCRAKRVARRVASPAALRRVPRRATIRVTAYPQPVSVWQTSRLTGKRNGVQRAQPHVYERRRWQLQRARRQSWCARTRFSTVVGLTSGARGCGALRWAVDRLRLRASYRDDAAGPKRHLDLRADDVRDTDAENRSLAERAAPTFERNGFVLDTASCERHRVGHRKGRLQSISGAA